jgi:hypothetical protein
LLASFARPGGCWFCWEVLSVLLCRLATHVNYQQFVEEQGIEFFPLGGDPEFLSKCELATMVPCRPSWGTALSITMMAVFELFSWIRLALHVLTMYQ